MEAELYDTKPSRMEALKVPKGYMAIQVISVGGAPKQSILGVQGYHIFVSKEQGKKLFDISKGAKLKLRGGTQVLRRSSMGTDYDQVFFKVSSFEIIN